jgi:hypothetical protein
VRCVRLWLLLASPEPPALPVLFRVCGRWTLPRRRQVPTQAAQVLAARRLTCAVGLPLGWEAVQGCRTGESRVFGVYAYACAVLVCVPGP